MTPGEPKMAPLLRRGLFQIDAQRDEVSQGTGRGGAACTEAPGGRGN
jgi:hypothetical protein